jgi:hypothetical protein
MVQRLIPGVGYVDDEGGGQRLIPGIGFVDATEGVAAILPDLLTNTQTFYAAEVYLAGSAQSITPDLFTNTQTFYTASVAHAITISDNFDRSSVNVSLSSSSGSGDDAIISIKPRYQESEITGSTGRWWEFSARIDGVNGFRPSLVVQDYRSGYLFGHPWDSGHRCHFSYDRITWYPFDTISRDDVNYTVTSRHNTAFTANTVYFANTPQFTDYQVGSWIADLDANYASVEPTTTGGNYTPTPSVSAYAAQAFICDEFSTQLDELSRTIPITPFYGFQINDTSLMPADGLGKRIAVITGGVHAAEDLANYCLKAFVESFLGGSAEAQALRRQYKLLVYPIINAPGRAGGGWRGSFTQGTSGADDANRHFTETNSTLEIVDKPKATIVTDRGGLIPDWALDFHTQPEYGWSIYTAGAAEDVFRSRQASNAGVYVTDMGGAWGDNKYVHQYFHELGAKISTAVELGDANVITPAAISSYHAAMVETLSSMLDDGYLFNSISPAALTNVQTFYGATVAVGAANIAPDLLVNEQIFYAPIISRSGDTQIIEPPLAENISVFHTTAVSTGVVYISPPYFENAQAFYAATVTVGGGSPTTLNAADLAAIDALIVARIADIAAAILAAAQVTPIHSNVQAVNDYTVKGSGTESDPWNPV